MRLRLPCTFVFSALLAAHEPGSILGHARDAAGRPVAGAAVSLTGNGLALKILTDADGAFRFTGLKPGGYTLLVQRAGFQGVRRFVDLRAEHGAELELTLQPFVASATVEVVDKAGLAHLSDLDAPINHLLGIADTASQGVVTPEKLGERAYLRAGEILETVPGLLISQHSGEGKANQYYLRGFDLDHGTDISATVAGLPVNMPTHAHGQGYSDLNFLIPELVRDIQYEKGTTFAQEGDFSAAGAVHIDYVHALDRPLAQVEVGADGYRRFLAAGSLKVGQGDLLAALELFHNDGPWVDPDDYRKFNGVLRYSRVGPSDSLEVTAMSYSGRWNSSDQIPQRAIDQGLIGRFGEIDPTDGGASHRNSLTAAWQHAEQDAQTRVEAYVSTYALNLISNFTYFLNDPVHGDQFEQVDHRVVSGLRASQRWSDELFGHPMDNELGLQVRNDNILGLDLYHTQARQILSTILEDRVTQTSEAFYWENKIQWAPAFRTVVGLREDLYQFDVRSNTPQNTGLSHADLASPKLSLIFGPWRDTEFYLSGGYGFHSNDARGTTLSVDPQTGAPQDRVTPLVRAKGYEIGVRTSIVPAWQSTLSLWRLDIASELTFGGDDGTTSPSRPSRRQGIEWNNEVHFTDRLSLNADLAYSTAFYTAYDSVGDHIPQSIAGVGVAGLAWRPADGLQLSLLDRYFGPRYLIEDGSVRSRSANQVQVQARWSASRNLTLTFDVFNLFNTQATDIDYYYASRLPGEPAGGVDDVHLHPIEPREWRLGAKWVF
ncbi:MAG: TonB-dependent receptor [Acidobacteriota bacterium]|nr:TonB-dependent receptor [Acidobacteriota bacterium]